MSMWAVTASKYDVQVLCRMLKTEKKTKSPDCAAVYAFRFEEKLKKKFTRFPKTTGGSEECGQMLNSVREVFQ